MLNVVYYINIYRLMMVSIYVQVIEFESTALMIGQLGLRVNLIAYPVVSVKKVSHMISQGAKPKF